MPDSCQLLNKTVEASLKVRQSGLRLKFLICERSNLRTRQTRSDSERAARTSRENLCEGTSMPRIVIWLDQSSKFLDD